MANPSELPRGNVTYTWVLGVTLTPSSVANATSAEQTFTCTGVRLGDFIDVNKPTAQAGLGIVGSRAQAKDVIAITFQNSTAATITPTAAEIYTVKVDRPVNVSMSGVSTLSVA